MDDFPDLPVHAQNALRRAGVTSLDQARALGRDGLARVPGLGPLAISRLFPAAAAQPRSQALSSDELKRAMRWFDVLEEVAPLKLNDGDRALARKIGGWVG